MCEELGEKCRKGKKIRKKGKRIKMRVKKIREVSINLKLVYVIACLLWIAPTHKQWLL